MAIQTLPEKLEIKDEKNLLIQGLPSSIEKQFVKLSFAKNVTPLLKTRKIDFALVFAVNQKQLKEILKDVVPALHKEAKLWVAYPKLTSKIASDLCREVDWDFIGSYGYACVRAISLDPVWTAMWFKKPVAGDKKKESFSAENPAPGVDYEERTIEVPAALDVLLEQNKNAAQFFESLSFSNKREFIEWLAAAKKPETTTKRLSTIIEKLIAGKRNPTEK